MASIRRPMSAGTRAKYDRIKQRQHHNAQTPSKAPGHPTKSEMEEQPQVQHLMKAKVSKELEYFNTSSDSETHLFKALEEDALQKQSSRVQHEGVRKSDASIPDRRRLGEAAGLDQTTPEKARSAMPPGDISATGIVKQPIFAIRKVSRDPKLERIHERREFTFGVNEYHIVESQVQPPRRRSPRKKFGESPTARDDSGPKQSQAEAPNSNNRSPSYRESFSLEQRLANLQRDVKTPLKTYSQNRTIAASQGGQVTPGEEPAEGDGDDEDATRDSQDDDEDVDEIDIEILHLGKEKLVTTPAGRHDANGRASPRSPKRPRDVAKSKPADRDKFSPVPGHWDDGDFEQPAQKRQRRSNRQIPNVVVRKTALQKLIDRRDSNSHDRSRKVQGDTTSKKMKAKGPKSSQKKPPRKLPVNELVTASQRNDSDVEEDIAKPMEVPEDPILLSSDEEPETHKGRGQKTKTKVSIKWRPGHGFGHIDVNDFRIPHSQAASANFIQPTYSDGFVGKEAEPIGRLMPMPQSSRRQSPTQRITVHMGELTLVAERTFSEDDVQEQDDRPRRRRRPHKSARLSQEGAHGDEGEDLMLIDNVELRPVPTCDKKFKQPLIHEVVVQGNHKVKVPQQVHESRTPLQQIGEEQKLVQTHEIHELNEESVNEPMLIDSTELESARVHREGHFDSQHEQEPELLLGNVDEVLQRFSKSAQKSPIPTKIASPNLQTSVRKSCLKQQPSTKRRVSFAGIDPSQQEIARRSTQHGSQESSVPAFSQNLKNVSISTKSSRAREQEELEVYRQLSMVTAPRRPSPDTGSDDESEEIVCEEESEEEQSGEEEPSDDERELTPAGSSEEEDPDEPAEEIPYAVAINGFLPNQATCDEDMPDRPFINSKQTEMKVPQVVIYTQKSVQRVAPAACQAIQPYLRQIEGEAQDFFENRNPVQKHGETENVRPQSESPDGSWRPTQVTQPTSSGVLSEYVLPSAACEQIEQIEDAIQNAPVGLEPKSKEKVEEDNLMDSQNPDSTWRPRQPISTGRLIEVAEDIETSPTPVPARQLASSQRRSLSQRHAQSRRHSKPLSLAQSRLSPDVDRQIAIAVPHTKRPFDSGNAQLQQNTGLDSQASIELGGDHTFGHYRSKVKDVDSQGSTILGGSQPFFARSNSHPAPSISNKREDSQISNNESSVAIPETEPEPEPEPGFRESQQSYVPEIVSYFARATQKLKEPLTSGRLSRTKSTPAKLAFLGPGIEDPNLMAGGISMEEAFAYSPSKTSPIRPSTFRTPVRLPTLLEEKSTGQKSLRTLTREASLGLGTMPGTARKRMMSLPFVPPLKRTPDGENKSSTA